MTRSRQVPVVLVDGLQEAAVASASLSLLCGFAGAVSVRHAIDVERQVLVRVVSDLGGVLEHEEIDLEHACVACAVREDIVPTLQRLAVRGEWAGIVACLPVAAASRQVCRALADAPHRAPQVSVAGVVTALDGGTITGDLLGDDLLAERGLATSDDDRRGVAEVACALVEHADAVCLTSSPAPDETSLLTALARPGVPLVTDPSRLDAAAVVAGGHHHEEVESWVADVRRGPLPPLPRGAVWRLDLRSERPLHPLRFLDELAVIGGGPRRSRGCFWLPTRPDAVCVWDGAGGQASIGTSSTWGRRTPLTRITVTGLDDDRRGRAAVAAAFERSLLTDHELRTRGRAWAESWDGLEPWLGPIDDVA